MVSNINGISAYAGMNKYPVRRIGKNKNVSFAHETNPLDKSNNGKFDISEAIKNFGKGIISPLKAIVKHPIATLGIVAGTAVATTLVPALGVLATVGFGALGLYQMGKGTYNAMKNYSNGNYDQAEKSFDKIGEGFVGTTLSLLGLKSSNATIKEAQLMNELKTTALTAEQRASIASQVKNQSFISTLKDVGKALTSKDGLTSLLAEFKPSMIKARFGEFKNIFTRKGEEVEQTVTRKRPMTEEEFKKTPEGIRRANLTDEQIEQEVNATIKDAFDRLGLKEELRPKVKIEKSGSHHGGSYNKGHHEIEFNPESYKAGTFEMEDVLMHEATHCKEALMRAGIPKAKAEEIIKEELISRIMNGESEEILIKGNICGADMMTPPKMSPAMKQDFIELAQKELYTRHNNELSSYIDRLDIYKNPYNKNTTLADVAEAKQKVQPLLDKLQRLIDKNPEFVSQYSSPEEALEMLAKYSLSHNTRYNIFSNINIKGLKIEELTGEELLHAEQSLRDNIATTEGNARMSGFKIFTNEKEFNQYQFSPEEVLAQQNGNNYLIETMTNRLNTLRESGNLTSDAEQTLLNVIEKAKKVVEYKTKGLDFYSKYTQSLNQPENTELANLVKNLGEELKALKGQIDEYNYIQVVETIKRTVYNLPSINRPDVTGATYEMLGLLEN